MATADFTLKAHDTAPAIQATLSIGGTPVNLTGATVKFIMASQPGGTITVNAAATIVDAANGVVRYVWLAADTATPGSYEAEWQVTYTDGTKQTFPTVGYHSISIEADLDNA